MGWLDRFKQGMKKTAAVFKLSSVDLNTLEEVEEALLCADAGVETTEKIMAALKRQKPQTKEKLLSMVHRQLIEIMTPVAKPLEIDRTKKPFVVLMSGVNGAGKTTTIGKLGQFYTRMGLRVSFAAADTFRAGATEQLSEWGRRIGCKVYTAQTGADAAGLVFDALKGARAAQDDILFIDTAGRLHNKTDLMNELSKIVRVIKKTDETAPHAAVLVLDATVGQNAVAQTKAFSDCIGITGLIMTKLDGTAKGGVLLALTQAFSLPIYALGVGEGADDLHPFTAEQYADSLLGED